MKTIPPFQATLAQADEAQEGLYLLAWLGLGAFAIFAVYFTVVFLIPIAASALFRPERRVGRSLLQTLIGCAAFPPIGLGVVAISRELSGTAGWYPPWIDLCLASAAVAIPTIALGLVFPKRRIVLLAAGMLVWIALCAVYGALDPP